MTDPKLSQPQLKRVTAQYRNQLAAQGIPPQPAGLIALAIVRFETNQGRPHPTTRQLIYQYKTQVCRANLWRFQLLNPTSRRRINTRHPHP